MGWVQDLENSLLLTTRWNVTTTVHSANQLDSQTESKHTPIYLRTVSQVQMDTDTVYEKCTANGLAS